MNGDHLFETLFGWFLKLVIFSLVVLIGGMIVETLLFVWRAQP